MIWNLPITSQSKFLIWESLACLAAVSFPPEFVLWLRLRSVEVEFEVMTASSSLKVEDLRDFLVGGALRWGGSGCLGEGVLRREF